MTRTISELMAGCAVVLLVTSQAWAQTVEGTQPLNEPVAEHGQLSADAPTSAAPLAVFAQLPSLNVEANALLSDVAASTALLQSTGAPGSNTQTPGVTSGPMTVERERDGFAIAPDFKVSKIDGVAARLAGGYGGWMIDNTLLIGAGGYWLTNGSDFRSIGYGGLVVEWLAMSDRPFGFGLRGLFGGGGATLGEAATVFTIQPPPPHPQPLMGTAVAPFIPAPIPVPTSPQTVTFPVNRGFTVVEPQADFLINFTQHLRLNWSVGYRFIGGASDGFDNRLHGTSASVSLELGGSTTSQH